VSVFSDDFIDGVITPETETTNPSQTMEISREFYGMEAVAQFDEEFMDAQSRARGEE